jgi:hypothetical protein
MRVTGSAHELVAQSLETQHKSTVNQSSSARPYIPIVEVGNPDNRLEWIFPQSLINC